MVYPAPLTEFFVLFFLFRLNLWNQWLFNYSIQIFMQPVEKEVEKFLRILLLLVAKLSKL